MDIRAIIFDKDGTLADFPATFNPATGRVIELLSKGDESLASQIADVWDYDLETASIRDASVIVAGSNMEIAMALKPVLDIGDPDEFTVYLDGIYGEISVNTVVAIDGVKRALEDLGKLGLRMGIATNDGERNAVAQMQVLGFHGFFDHIFGADSGYGAKPGSGMIDAFLEATSLKPEHVLMVGDSTHDLDAGRAAGVLTCGVETGPAKRHDLEHAADIVLASVADLPAWLRS